MCIHCNCSFPVHSKCYIVKSKTQMDRECMLISYSNYHFQEQQESKSEKISYKIKACFLWHHLCC